MTITTKKNVDDKVWVLHEGNIRHLKIQRINVVIGDWLRDKRINQIKELYHLYQYGHIVVSKFSYECFDTREELLKSLEQ